MSIKWLVFFFSTWFILALIGAGVEKSFAGVTEGGQYVAVIDTLMSARMVSDISIGGMTVGWLPNMEWFGALVKAITFRYTFMSDSFIGWMGYATVFIPIAISMLIATLFSVRGSASS